MCVKSHFTSFKNVKSKRILNCSYNCKQLELVFFIGMTSSSDNEVEENMEEYESDEILNDDSVSDEDQNNEEQNPEDDEERTEIRNELKNMSFEEIIKLKQKLGAKVYNEAILGKTPETKKARKKIYKRQNANRPMEMSSKRPVPFGISVIPKQKEIRDPRFDPKCGEFESSQFKERYDFINNMRDSELNELKEKLNTTEDHEEEKNLKFVIQRMDNQLREEKKRKKKVIEVKEAEKEKRLAKAEGRKPFYKKESHKKAEDLVKQYLELKNAGKLEKHLEKRRKKLKTQDRKKFNFD